VLVSCSRTGHDRRVEDSPSAAPRHWWSPGLAVHALVVLTLVVAGPLTGPSTPRVVAAVAGAGDLLLGLPWWLITTFLYLLPLPSSQVLDAGISALPLLINLALHVVLLQAVRGRRRRTGTTGTGTRRPGPPRPHPAVVLAGSAGSGALLWGAWLGWDRSASYDVVTHSVQSPYVTLQVVGCALTVGVITALLAARWHPVAAAGGVALGFWLPWTVDAAIQDETGLFAVGSILLAIGLALGTALAAATGRGATWALRGARGRHLRRTGASEQ
jgi:hypothetical protein